MGMLALSLSNFEKENISKIDHNKLMVDRISSQHIQIREEMQNLKHDVEQSALRQDEAEQSFLQSFHDIKSIVLTKLSVFDKQIESKEEAEKFKASIEGLETMQKNLEDQVAFLTQKLNGQSQHMVRLIDNKLIALNDTLSVSLSHLTKKSDAINQIE